MGWKDTIQPIQSASAGGSWKDTITPIKSEPGMLESLGRGISQGVSGGFQDELGGAISALGRAAGFKDLEHGFQNGFERADDGATLDLDKIKDAYVSARDQERTLNTEAGKANPKTYIAGNIGGGVLQNMAAPGLSAAADAGLAANIGKGALQGSVAGAGYSDADNVEDFAKDTVEGAGLGGAAGAGGYGAGKLMSKVAPYFSNVAKNVGGAFQDEAENLAVKATGATGRQADKFADDAGRQLLDRKLVRPFDSPQNIADRLGQAIDSNSADLAQSVRAADATGSKINLVDYMNKAEEKVKELRLAGHGREADALEKQTAKMIDDANKVGLVDVSPSYMENVKRGQQNAINWQADNINEMAGKRAAASMARQSVEDSITDPQALSKFKDEKSLYGLLSPIEDAASKRASTLNQSPLGGLGDAAAAAAGMVPGGSTVAGLGTAFGRRVIAPRLASTGAFAADKIGQYIAESPQMFGKYANVLQQAAQRGPEGVASTHFILEQTDPAYREIIRTVADGDQQ